LTSRGCRCSFFGLFTSSMSLLILNECPLRHVGRKQALSSSFVGLVTSATERRVVRSFPGTPVERTGRCPLADRVDGGEMVRKGVWVAVCKSYWCSSAWCATIFDELVVGVVVERQRAVETRGQARVRGDEPTHLVRVASNDDHDLVAVVLHQFDQGRDRLLTEVVGLNRRVPARTPRQ